MNLEGNRRWEPLSIISVVYICLITCVLLTGGGLPHERGGDARRKFRIKLLKGTNLGVAQFFLPLRAIILNFDDMNRVNKKN